LELAERMAELGRTISASQRALFADIAEFDEVESWRGDGAVSMAAWLTERCGVSGATARIWVRTAAKLKSLPHLAGALADGTLSLDSVAPLADVATPASESELAEAAVHWTVKQIRELAASHRGTTDAAAARRFENRTFRFNDDKATIWAALTQDDYVVAKAALVARMSWGERDAASSLGKGAAGAEKGVEKTGNGGDPLGYVPFDQRLYDAFMDLCRVDETAESSGEAGIPGEGGMPGEGGRRNEGGVKGAARRFRPTIVVHADLGMLTGLNPDGIAELSGVGPVSTEVARRLACDAKVIFSLERRDGSILDQKRVRRSPTSAQRIEIARRDKGCRFSSCSFRDFTEVHHVVPWTLGGETNLSNLITLCGRHHHAVHELGWSMKGNADGVVTFQAPNGHRMTSAPSPTWRRQGSAPARR
jgi:hypothetical protein